jgi:hypothetical protein
MHNLTLTHTHTHTHTLTQMHTLTLTQIHNTHADALHSHSHTHTHSHTHLRSNVLVPQLHQNLCKIRIQTMQHNVSLPQQVHVFSLSHSRTKRPQQPRNIRNIQLPWTQTQTCVRQMQCEGRRQRVLFLQAVHQRCEGRAVPLPRMHWCCKARERVEEYAIFLL